MNTLWIEGSENEKIILPDFIRTWDTLHTVHTYCAFSKRVPHIFDQIKHFLKITLNKFGKEFFQRSWNYQDNEFLLITFELFEFLKI